MKTEPFRYPLGAGSNAQEFHVGQRVRLSKLGIARTLKSTARVDTVVGLPAPSSIDIRFDGNKRPTKLHRSYVELDEDELSHSLVELGLRVKK
jgi:hypothetical protein